MTTILCSTYNSNEWIDNYLNYVNSQFVKEFDIIFVDANSSDGSLGKIKNYNFRDGIKKTIIENSSKIPIYEAWNQAVLAAKTPYVINYNTDDCLYPTAILNFQIYASINSNVDIFYSPCFISKDKDHKNISNIYLWRDYTHEELLKGCFLGPFPYVKRQTLIDDGLFNPKYTISGDYEMWLRMSKKGRSFLKIPEVNGCYFHNPIGTSTKNDEARWKEHLRQDFEIRNLHK
jgi:glycosyltransferase involved in cell wall biosynthesis